MATIRTHQLVTYRVRPNESDAPVDYDVITTGSLAHCEDYKHALSANDAAYGRTLAILIWGAGR